jgi:hypothetical protein
VAFTAPAPTDDDRVIDVPTPAIVIAALLWNAGLVALGIHLGRRYR